MLVFTIAIFIFANTVNIEGDMTIGEEQIIRIEGKTRNVPYKWFSRSRKYLVSDITIFGNHYS